MGKVLSIKDMKPVSCGRARRLERIKEKLLRCHGIDLEQLLAAESATSLIIDQFEELTERILATAEGFCEEHPQLTIHDVLHALENVQDIIRENTSWNEER